MTTLRSLGPKPWKAAYVQPSRRPKDGRYGENPNRLQHYYQYQAILKPSPENLQALYLDSPAAIGVDMGLHDVRFVEDHRESPTLGAWGLGWECWCDGMKVSQFTYFQQVAGFECAPVSGELTYGLERLAMYAQGVDSVYDLNFNGGECSERVSYGDVFLQAEEEYSRFNFEFANTEVLFQHFRGRRGRVHGRCGSGARRAACHLMALPAYDQCIKASHVFNLLDVRRAIIGHRAPELYPEGARTRAGLRRGLAQDGGRRGRVTARTMTMTKDEKAKELIEAEIPERWPEVVSVSITPRIDFLDEPASQRVLVDLKTIRGVPEFGTHAATCSRNWTQSCERRATNAQPIWRFRRLTRVADAEPTESEGAERIRR